MVDSGDTTNMGILEYILPEIFIDRNSNGQGREIDWAGNCEPQNGVRAAERDPILAPNKHSISNMVLELLHWTLYANGLN